MKKYRAILSKWTPDTGIVAVEVERETARFIWIEGRRRAKRSEYYSYYDTWQEAKYVLQKCTQNRVDALERDLERMKTTLEYIKGVSEAK